MKISISEPVSQLRHIAIKDNGEPLVDFLNQCSDLKMDTPRFQYRRERVIRQAVAEMLCEANKRLPAGYRLAIIEGWRPPHIQRRMYLTVWQQFQERHPDWSDVKLKRVVNRFTAPMNLRVPPPHTTGGAVDVALVLTDGTPCDAHSPYDWDDPASFPFDAPGLSDEARRTRAMLADALIPTGLTNYPSEYWHWSYGDQGWAYRGGHPYALYAAITPPNWTPDPADEGESPLEWVGQYAADNAA